MDVKYAGFWVRLGAMLIDILVMLPFSVIFIWLQTQSLDNFIMLLIPYSLIYPAYYIYFHGKYAATLGKMAVNIKVIEFTGNDIDYKIAFKRYSPYLLLGFLSACAQMSILLNAPESEFNTMDWMQQMEYIGGQPSVLELLSGIGLQILAWGGLISLLINPQKRALHDFLAGTVVVHRQQ